MRDETILCRKCRDHLLEVLLEAPRQEKLPEEIAAHLERCASCREYRAVLRRMTPVAPGQRLYTPGLRYRTIARMEQRWEEGPLRQERWLVLAVLVGLTLSYFLPLWILVRLLGHWISSTPLALAAAAFFFALLGVATSAVAAAVLFEKKNGLIQVKRIELREDRHV